MNQNQLNKWRINICILFYWHWKWRRQKFNDFTVKDIKNGNMGWMVEKRPIRNNAVDRKSEIKKFWTFYFDWQQTLSLTTNPNLIFFWKRFLNIHRFIHILFFFMSCVIQINFISLWSVNQLNIFFFNFKGKPNIYNKL